MRPARLGAAVVLVALAGGAADAGSRESPPPATPGSTVTTTSERHPELVTISAPTTTTYPAPATLATRGPLDAATEGMAAWGRFAVEGDLKTVAPWFSRAGPQWRQFEMEAVDLAREPLGGPPYSVVVDEPAITGDGAERRVEARVTFVRTGEPSQTFDWIIVLRPEGGEWRIWTVEEVSRTRRRRPGR